MRIASAHQRRRLASVLLGVTAAAALIIVACTGDDPETFNDPCASPLVACVDSSASAETSTNNNNNVDSGPGGDGAVACTAPCNGDLLWLRSFGSGLAGDGITQMVVDATGNIYILGFTNGAIGFGEDGGAPSIVSGTSAFVVKLDAEGKVVWVKPIGGHVLDPHIALDAIGNVFLAGVYFLDAAGPITWGGEDTGLGPNKGATGYDIFVLAIGADGTKKLATQIGGDGYDEMYAVGTDADGSPVFFGKLNIGGPFVAKLDKTTLTQTWSHSILIGAGADIRGVAIVPLSSNDLAVAGTYVDPIDWASNGGGSAPTSPAPRNTFLMRLQAADGGFAYTNENFTSLYGSNANLDAGQNVTTVSAIAFAPPSPSIALVGTFLGEVLLGTTTSTILVGDAGDMTRDPGTYLATFNTTSFNSTFSRGIFDDPSPPSPEEKYVAMDDLGNVSVGGVFKKSVDFGGGPLTSAGDDDGFVALYDSKLKPKWSKRLGGMIKDRVGGIGADPKTGAVIIAGEFQSSNADFPGAKTPLDAKNGQPTIFLMKLAR